MTPAQDLELSAWPSSHEAAHELLQARVTASLRSVGIFTVVLTVFSDLVYASAEGWAAAYTRAFNVREAINCALGLLFIAVGTWAQRRVRSRGLLELLDVAAVFLLCAWMDGSLFALPVAELSQRRELSLLLIFTNLLLARAAVVPSTGRRTAWIGTVSFGSLVAVSYFIHAAHEPPREAWGHAGEVMVWAITAIASSSFISRRLYTLQRAVDAARRFGQYTLEEKIGEGGMGEVFRARHALLRRPTAVKLLPASRSGGEAIARFEREVQLTSRLTHPSTIQIYDFGRAQDGTFYYAMELVEGMTLEELVMRVGAQPPGRVARILADICGSLTEAHEAGLVHRDIKPQNVMLCARGGVADVVKVLDFGLVKSIGEGVGSAAATAAAPGAGRATRGLAGTPAYVAPEVITDPESFAAPSDLYAVGAVGYFLLTGSPVFDGGSAFDLLAQHLHADPIAPSRRASRPIPAELEALVLGCLAKSPADRPASARALRASLLGLESVVATWNDADAARWWTENAAVASSPVSANPGASPLGRPRDDRRLRVAERISRGSA